MDEYYSFLIEYIFNNYFFHQDKNKCLYSKKKSKKLKKKVIFIYLIIKLFWKHITQLKNPFLVSLAIDYNAIEFLYDI